TATPTIGAGPTSCPISYTFTATGSNADFDYGWRGEDHDRRLPSNRRVTLALSGCAGSAPAGGQCNVTGPIAKSRRAAFANQRCRLDSSVSCTSDGQCTGAGNACVFFLGPPQPEVVAGLSVCVTNEITPGVTGTINATTGSAAFTLPMRITEMVSFNPV